MNIMIMTTYFKMTEFKIGPNLKSEKGNNAYLKFMFFKITNFTVRLSFSTLGKIKGFEEVL